LGAIKVLAFFKVVKPKYKDHYLVFYRLALLEQTSN